MQRAQRAMFRGGDVATDMARAAAQSQQAVELPAGAGLNPKTLPTQVVYSYDASVADKTIQIVQPTLPITSTQFPEFLLTATNAPGVMWDLHGSWLVLDWTVAPGVGQYTVPHPLGNSMLLFKDWQLLINDTNLSEQNSSLDQYSSFAKAALLYPRRPMGQHSQYTSGTLYSTTIDSGLVDQETMDGLTTPSFAKGLGAPTSYTDNPYTQAIENITRIVNHRYQTRVFVPHPLFQQQRYVPASFNIRLRMTAIDPTYGYACAQASGDTPTITINSLTWYVPRVTLTSAGLSVYRSLLAEAQMSIRYACLRTQLQTFSLPAGQTTYDFSMLSRRRPAALCFHVVPTTHTQPGTIGQGIQPFEQLVGDAFKISTLRVTCGGEQFPKYSNYAVTRGPEGAGSAGGTSPLDIAAYERLCFSQLQTDKKVQPLLDLKTLALSGQICMLWMDLTSNQQGLIDQKSPLEMIGNLDIQIVLQNAMAANHTLLLTALFNDIIALTPGNGAVTPGW